MGYNAADSFDRIMTVVMDADVRGEQRMHVARALIQEFDQQDWDTQDECQTRSDPWVDEAFRRAGHVREAEAEARGDDPADGQREASGVPSRGEAALRRRNSPRGRKE